jgi:uncharacterized membrane protein
MIDFIYLTLKNLGFSHPLHPAITHIPMGMVIGGFLFALASFLLKKEELTQTAHHCYTLALIFVLPTMILGYMDWQYKFDAEWSALILVKIILAVVFCGLLLAAYFSGKNKQMDVKIITIYGLCLVNAIALGFMGGEIQYG